MDLEDELVLMLIICWYWMINNLQRIERIRDNTSALSGHAYTQELLTGSNTQCHEMMRLSRDAYVLLCNHFKQKNWLTSSRTISVEEKMAMFLITLGHNESSRAIKRRFQHSTQTIHKCFHEVRRAMMKFAREIIVPTSSEATTNMSQRNRNLREKLPGAVGALDGTLIHAVVPHNQQTRYRGRGKGECYQNVLGICDFDMIFTFVWAGWEGIAHDARVLTEVAYNPTSGFPFPPPVQRDVVIACFAIHNFIRKYNIYDEVFPEFEDDEEPSEENEQQNMQGVECGSQGIQFMNNLLDEIANQLFSNEQIVNN
ncbi:uncharacterized protein [Rutidosis leptorrhynchoides]|uniref:uncharacterized protein n=1 Tax=Rutidosis leptorrhynchoides TaxID=125765 RepID=UPI003A995CDC